MAPVIGFLELVAVGLLAAVVVGVIVALRSAAGRGKGSGALGEEARWLLRPIRQQRDGLAELAQKSQAPEVRIIAAEAVAEADAVLEHATRLATARESLKRNLKSQGEAETNLNRLQRQYVEASSESERSALESAMNARSQEIQAYGSAQERIKEIDGKLREAEATLAELRARLTAGSIGSLPASLEDSEFSDVVSRLKGLGRSFDEVQAELEVSP